MERISFKDAPADIFQVMRQVQTCVDNSGLDHKQLDLMRMRVSQINSCAYCLDMHSKEALHAGETILRVVSVSAWRETTYYTPQEQAVLAFAEYLTRMPEEQHSDHVHDELAKHFSKQEIAYLTLAIIQINSWNRVVRSFGTVAGNYKVQGS